MLKNLSIRTNLILFVAIPVIASMIITTIGIYYVNRISQDLTQSLYNEGFHSSAQVLNADRDMYQALENMNLMMINNLEGTLTTTRKSEYMAGFQENADQTKDRAKSAVEILSAQQDFWGSIQDDGGLTVFDHYEAFQADFQQWEESNSQVAATYTASEEWTGYFGTSRDHLNVIGELVEKGVNQSIQENEASKKAMILMLLAINAVVLLVVAIMSVAIIRGIISPLRKIVEMLKNMSMGRLSQRLQLNKKDEIGVMADTLDEYAEDLQVNVIGVMQKIASGDLSMTIDARDSEDEVSPAIKGTVDTLKNLVAETETLTRAAAEGRLATRGDAEAFQGSYREIVQGVNNTLDAVIGPLNVAADYVERISKGDIPEKITDEYNGDFNIIKNDLNTCIDAINELVADAAMLAEAAVEGRLATRADAEKHGGDFRRIVEGVNDTLDAVIDPLNVAAEYVARISRGDIPEKITDEYNGDFNTIKNNLNTCIDAVNELVADAAMLAEAAATGRLSTRADAEKHGGDFRRIVEGVNDTLDAVIGPLNVAADYMDRISKGDIPEKITDEYNGDFNTIKNNLNTCIDAVNRIVGDLNQLSAAIVRGNLRNRRDESLHSGDFAAIIAGVNRTLDKLVGYLDEMPAPVIIMNQEMKIQYINQAGASLSNKSPQELHGTACATLFNTDDCEGGHCACRRAMDEDRKVTAETTARVGGKVLEIQYTGMPVRDESGTVIGAMEMVVDQTEVKQAARLAEKQADYQASEVERLIGNLEKIASGDLDIQPETAEGDADTMQIRTNFEKINHSLSQSAEALQAMMADVRMLARAAVEGRLDTRAEAARHQGDFRRIVEGVNETLDAVIEPIKEATEVLKYMAEGNLKVMMLGMYQGDHAVIKEALNSTLMNLDTYVSDISRILSEISGGNLDLSVTVDYKGDFSEIKDSLNSTLMNLGTYVSDISRILSEISAGNLDLSVTVDYKGDFSEIKDSLTQIIGSLSQVMGDIGEAADQVASGSRQVSDGSQALSQGSTEQASSIQELTASIAEIASQTKQNAVNAGQASQLAATARESAEKGNDQMKGMLSSMEAINESSANISKIIKVIDDIAFQTNILALNAAVEAARAGQHGKGFAVVAEEVRNLAARSAAAARETTDLIEGSIQKVQDGTRIANATASALEEIVGGVEKAANLVVGIAEASNEQASGIAQINKGIEQVSQVVQNNSATAEESAAASEELSSQAELLKEMVSRFKVNKSVKALGTGEPRMLTGRTQPGPTLSDSPRILLDDSEFDKY